MRELVLHAVRLGMLRQSIPSEARLARVVVDQLETLPTVPLQLPMPRDDRARRAAERLLLDPGEPIDEAARVAGASKRTLERLFRSETAMTLGRWRQRLRLIEALRLLAAGQPVTRVALDVGYDSPSAFITAFRRELGTTPGRYFESSTPDLRISSERQRSDSR
jgi:AraC-like DNA-binding protein